MGNSSIYNMFIKALVRSQFTLTSRHQATKNIRNSSNHYLNLADRLDLREGSICVLVPPMRGVDEDMRNWSFFMILEHTAIVNRSITSIVKSLARGEKPSGAGEIDHKKDVMPSVNPGKEQILNFQSSVEAHLKSIPKLGRLRGGLTKNHTIFGKFDAHRWHCMFGFHMSIHLNQAHYVFEKVCSKLGEMDKLYT